MKTTGAGARKEPKRFPLWYARNSCSHTIEPPFLIDSLSSDPIEYTPLQSHHSHLIDSFEDSSTTVTRTPTHIHTSAPLSPPFPTCASTSTPPSRASTSTTHIHHSHPHSSISYLHIHLSHPQSSTSTLPSRASTSTALFPASTSSSRISTPPSPPEIHTPSFTPESTTPSTSRTSTRRTLKPDRNARILNAINQRASELIAFVRESIVREDERRERERREDRDVQTKILETLNRMVEADERRPIITLCTMSIHNNLNINNASAQQSKSMHSMPSTSSSTTSTLHSTPTSSTLQSTPSHCVTPAARTRVVDDFDSDPDDPLQITGGIIASKKKEIYVLKKDVDILD
ncbi:hypothetical protein M8J77_006685 [Diaphorina citri]|nr:hypothetical protein M8J77_006685 [Diaphorina citri]